MPHKIITVKYETNITIYFVGIPVSLKFQKKFEINIVNILDVSLTKIKI